MEINKTNQSINFTGRKIPRFVYHLTNKKNYNQMCKDGFIKTTDSDPYIKDSEGIFTIDWNNFCKLWGHHKSWGENGYPLQYSLLREAVKWVTSYIDSLNELVIIKIPTDKLKQNKLAVRSQHLFFEVKENDLKLNQLTHNQLSHLSGNTPATQSKLLKRRNAVEFIYKEPIPIENTEQIGSVLNIAEFRKSAEFDSDNPVKCILSKALNGLNESKAIEYIKE